MIALDISVIAGGAALAALPEPISSAIGAGLVLGGLGLLVAHADRLYEVLTGRTTFNAGDRELLETISGALTGIAGVAALAQCILPGAVRAITRLSRRIEGIRMGGDKGVREAYEAAVKKLGERAVEMRRAGMSSEDIARALHAERNALKETYRDMSSVGGAKTAAQRNTEMYGNSMGPSIDDLRAAGKSWDDIIESAARPGGADLGF
jgi:hypothetical protein